MEDADPVPGVIDHHPVNIAAGWWIQVFCYESGSDLKTNKLKFFLQIHTQLKR